MTTTRVTHTIRLPCRASAGQIQGVFDLLRQAGLEPQVFVVSPDTPGTEPATIQEVTSGFKWSRISQVCIRSPGVTLLMEDDWLTPVTLEWDPAQEEVGRKVLAHVKSWRRWSLVPGHPALWLVAALSLYMAHTVGEMKERAEQAAAAQERWQAGEPHRAAVRAKRLKELGPERLAEEEAQQRAQEEARRAPAPARPWWREAFAALGAMTTVACGWIVAWLLWRWTHLHVFPSFWFQVACMQEAYTARVVVAWLLSAVATAVTIWKAVSS